MVTYDLGKVVGDKGAKGDKGDKGDTGSIGPAGNGISSISLISTSGKVKTYRITYTNGEHFDFNVTDGNDGALDVVTSWSSTLSDSKVPSEKLSKTSLDGKADTNHTHSGYASSSHTHGSITNDGKLGSSANKPVITGSGGAVTTGSFGTSANTFCEGNDSRLSDARTPTSHTHGNLKNDGSVGSSNNASKNVVTDSNGKITTEAKPVIPSKISDLTDDSDFISKSNTAGLVKNDGSIDTNSYVSSSALSNYVQKSNTNGLLKNDGTVDTTSYSTFSGAYGDLSGKPTIPSKISDLTDDSDFISKSSTSGLVKNDGTIDTTSYSTFSGAYSDLSGKPTIPSKISDLTDDSDFIKTSSTTGLVKNDGTIDTSSYATTGSLSPVALSGDYDDLVDKPTIPSKLSDLTNDSDFIETSSTAGLVKNDGSIDTTSYSTFSGNYSDLNGKPSLATVATTGDYDDLTDKPSIPSDVSDLTDSTGVIPTDVSDLTDTSDTPFTPKSHSHGNITNAGAIGSTSGLPVKTGTDGVLTTGAFGTSAGQFAEGNHTHSGYVSATKVTSWSSTVSDSNVPSEKLVKDTLDELDALIGDAISYINQ